MCFRVFAKLFPRLRQRGNAQMRDAETAQPGLRLAAAAGRAFVADLAAVAGGGAGKRRDRGRVIMGFDLDAERAGGFGFGAIFQRRRIRAEALRRIAFHHRGVVAVRRKRVLGRLRVGVLDHLEQRDVAAIHQFFAAVDGPGRVEDLVPAVLGIGLREHHQFDIVRVAAQLGVARAQVFDFVFGQRQTQARIGALQVGQRDHFQRAARRGGEQRRRVGRVGQQRLGHRVVQKLRDGGAGGRVFRKAGQVDPGAALHPLHRLAGAAQQFAGLAGPRRDRAQPRRDEARDRTDGQRRARFGVRFENALQRDGIGRVAGLGFDPVREPGADDAKRGCEGLETGFETVATERRQGREALKDDHVRPCLKAGRRL